MPRLTLSILLCSAMVSSFAQNKLSYEVGVSIFTLNNFTESYYDEDPISEKQDFSPGLRLKLHKGQNALRLGYESFRHYTNYDEIHQRSTTWFTGTRDYKQHQFLIGYQRSFLPGKLRLLTSLDYAFELNSLDSDYTYWGCFGGGKVKKNSTKISSALQPTFGIQYQPFRHISATAETCFYLSNPNYYNLYYKPISTLSLNYHF